MDLDEKKIIPQLKPQTVAICSFLGPHSYTCMRQKFTKPSDTKRFSDRHFLSHQQHLKNDFWDKICFGLGVVCDVFTIFEHKVFSSLPFVRQDLQKVFNISMRKIISYPSSFIHCSYNYRCQDPFLTKRTTTRCLPKCMMLDV